ncbi:MAG: hypothetical protein BRC28_01590 [Nanohaloarchaea archaeon SW_4_43_9]|nr:MAG: hypothetical protein BRC28_01590 [Nanohaloarchaea archaeon SW_4_43_9]
MDEKERNRLKEIVDDLNKGMELPPYNTGSERGYSREYKEYKKEEKEDQRLSRYERLCIKFSEILDIRAGERTQEKLSPPLSLLKWDVTPGMVLSAAVGVSFSMFALWAVLFLVNMLLGPLIPISIMVIAGLIAVGSGAYIYYKPVYDAKNKVIKSSGEMILSILYMVIYMRSSPNLEGAIRFAGLNLEGPISKDLKGILWDVEVGKFNNIEKSLENYTRAWKNYNDDFLESLQLLKAAVNEPNKERRESLLQDSIDRILDGTQEKMKHYAQGLKTPVMILNAMGAMLPVLGMIMLPLISVFMGSSITITHLFLTFNIMLPGFLYWFMQRILSSRPPTVSSKPTSEESLPTRGKYLIESLNIEIPTWPIGLGIFMFIGFYGIVGYLIFPYTYPLSEGAQEASIPVILGGSDGASPLAMLMRSLSITSGLGLGIGTALILGNKKRKKAEENLRKIEQQFPTALFQLGNKISGGTPIELALEEAAESTSDLEISDLFKESSRNIRDMGMTFEKSIFDESYGSLRNFPSQMIHTVMKAILKSSDKGTHMASMAMMTISKYLDNIHKTQERLNDLMEDTTTTILMLAYLLAPIVSGIAVGMSQTIITAMYELSNSFSEIEGEIGGSQSGVSEPGFTGILGNLDTAIPPEVLQFVVGIYLIQLLFILGTFYMKIREGENKTYRNMFIGKILISGMIFYSLSLIIVSVLFGSIVQGVPT